MDALEHTYAEVSGQAEAFGFAASLIGRRAVSESNDEVDDGRLIKIWPIEARPRVLLELEYHEHRVRIYRHRTPELTKKYQGRAVSIAWVLNFMKANESLARARTQEARDRAAEQTKMLAQEIEQQLLGPGGLRMPEKRAHFDYSDPRASVVVNRCHVCDEPSIPGDNVCYRHIGE